YAVPLTLFVFSVTKSYMAGTRRRPSDESAPVTTPYRLVRLDETATSSSAPPIASGPACRRDGMMLLRTTNGYRNSEVFQHHQGLRLHRPGRRRQGRVRPCLRRPGGRPAQPQ